jgi:D-alanyl-D-alanine carboxypeptidase
MTLVSRILSLAVLAVALIFSAAPSAKADDRYAAFVIDPRTNEVLHADMADEARFPASLTKMMTLYMVFEAIQRGEITLQSQMVASREAARQPPSRLGVRRGDTLTVEQGIYALVTRSANDVAVMFAERLGGGESRFAQLMTARARKLGMAGTRFMNASGLPDGDQRTTARDMATLSHALMRDFPQYYPYFSTQGFSWRSMYSRNHNSLLGSVTGVDGLKTGYTRASGFNLASSAERNGRRVIVVVMGGASAAARDAQVAYLLEAAFERLENRSRTRDAAPIATYVGLPADRVTVQFGADVPAAAAPPPPPGQAIKVEPDPISTDELEGPPATPQPVQIR